MRLGNDDDAARVDGVYLGPRGWPFFWTARYIAYGIGGGLMLLLTVLERKFGVRLSFWSLAWTLFAVVLLTRWIGRYITDDVPARSIAQIFWQEVIAPRPARGEQSGHYRTTWIYKDGHDA